MSSGYVDAAASIDPDDLPVAPDVGNTEAKSNEYVQYAGFWERVGAAILDSMILWMPIMGLSLIVYVFLAPSFADSPDSKWITDAQQTISLIISLVYFAWLQSSSLQASYGQRAMGLKLADYNGERISFWRAAFRFMVSCILFFGFITVLWTKQKQTLHDFVAGTVVIREKISLHSAEDVDPCE